MKSLLAERILSRLKEKKMSISALEKTAGLKQNAARNITRGLSNKPSAETLQAIARVFGCTIQDLLDDTQTQAASFQDNFDDPLLLQQTVTCVLEILKKVPQKASVGQVFLILQEAYSYASNGEPRGIDRKFFEWLVRKTLP